MMSLESSTFASFKSYRVKQGVGSIAGIYTKNYFGDADVFVINQLSDIDFAGEDERCDPIEISCGNVNSSGSNNLFSENFENLLAQDQFLAMDGPTILKLEQKVGII